MELGTSPVFLMEVTGSKFSTSAMVPDAKEVPTLGLILFDDPGTKFALQNIADLSDAKCYTLHMASFTQQIVGSY